jgi:peptide/nickel transport system substrate-binding protein
LLALEPYDDHWIDAVGNISIQGFADSQAALRAFEEGSVNTLMNITTETEEQITDGMSDTAEIVPGNGFSSWELRSQHSFAPTMFREFKLAVSQVIDRSLIQQIFGEGEAELYSSFLGSTHPWHPENPDEVLTQIADSPQSNPERAREILEEAGWGWDSNGRLHYPPDKDLSPAWPEGSSPCDNPEEFPCAGDFCE